ncbi:proline-rich protein 36-like [Phycodurus eques]|uniref:proline-rich protein 36-like n=1 Tax=Phycodurus eques TaxID=693459 RepID=UPI002ACE7006|nr:proline-rich protein 36-like [Phycodurus eques]
MEDGENPNEVLLSLPSTRIQSSEVEKEIEGGNGNVSNKQSEEELNEIAENSKQDENSQQEDGHSTERNDTSKSVHSARTNESECNLKESKEEKGSLDESSRTISDAVQCHKTTSTWTRSKHKDVIKTSRNPEELPSQIKFGRVSRQPRIVSTNRALFEGTVSDVTGIGLFEASPVTDPSLLENSERILTKVKTLASMYSAKSGSMKVPLHQKRAIFVRRKGGDLTGLSSVSNQTRCNSQTKYTMEMKKTPKCDIPSHAPAKLSHSPADAKPKPRPNSDAQTDNKKESQISSQTKAQNNSITQSRNKLHVPATAQMLSGSQNHTKTNSKNQNHARSQEDKRSLREILMKEINDVQEKVMPGDQQNSTCKLQTHGFTLSRPRDFIAALNKEQDHSRLDDKLQKSITPEAMSPVSLRTSSSSLTRDKSNTLRSQLTEHHVYTEDSASDSPAVQDKHEPQYQIPAKHRGSTSEPRKDMPRIHSQPEYLVCTGPRHGDSSPGEMIMLSSAKNLLSAQHQTLVVQKTQQPIEECPKEAVNLVGGRHPVLAVSGGSSKEDLSTINKTKCELNSYLPQTWKYLPDMKGPGPTFLRKPREGPSPVSSVQVLESNVPETHSPSVESHDRLAKFISQKTPYFQAMPNTWKVNNTTSYEYREQDHQGPGPSTSRPILGPLSGCCSPPRALLDVFYQVETSSSLMVPPGQDTHLRTSPSVFRHTSPSPVRTSPPSPNLTPSSFPVRASTCSSPFRVIPSSPTPLANEGFVSPDTISRNPPCFSAPPSSVRSFSKRALPASSPTPSSAFSHSSFKGAGPIPSSPLRSPPCSSPVTSSSTFTRSLAASCISQTLAKKNNVRHQVQSSYTQGPPSTPSLPNSHPHRCSQSPRLSHSQDVSSTPVYSHLESAIDGNPCYPPSSTRSTCPSPSSAHLTFQSNSQNPFSSSLSTRQSHCPPLSSTSARHHHSPSHNMDSSQNANSSNKVSLPTSANCAVSNGSCSASPQKVPLANVSTSCATVQKNSDRLSFGSHNRRARPFSASEPNSRVPSPTPAVSPPSFARLCSPPPQHNYASAMANKPPEPRGSWTAGASSHNPLGLTLEILEASSASPSFGPASSCVSPQILSPPAIGVSVWTCDVAAPQPRNPQFTSPSCSFSSCSSQTTQKKASFSSSPFAPLYSLSAGSPYGHPNKPHTLRRSHSSLSETHPSPLQSGPEGPCYSWGESSQRSLGFTDTFDQRGSGPVSPRSGWSSNDGSPSCLSPRGGLQSPVSPRRVAPRRSDFGRALLFSSEPWLDGQVVCNNYNGLDGFYAGGTTTAVTLPSPPNSLSQSLRSSMAAEWGDPELEQGSCRSRLICAYVGGPPPEPTLSSSCVVLSPPPVAHHQIYQAHLQSPPQSPNVAPSRSSPAAFACPSLNKVSNQKTSYATTVNLQIAGSGRITSFSTAHVKHEPDAARWTGMQRTSHAETSKHQRTVAHFFCASSELRQAMSEAVIKKSNLSPRATLDYVHVLRKMMW